ncbi:hypothetical protein LSH36_389g02034 [Paralvinella palmiformis]|uniref:Uncharacterized protein n=1 Tax=Paralvinella palmiformis TaxID=53620 RepID=A0AAD9MYS5_9ANNE|nr:hypothetical protein LSH36_389g02034 [Paralvinella palmiformis]
MSLLVTMHCPLVARHASIISFTGFLSLQSPPKGATIPYRPKPALPPVLFAGGQPYAMQPGQFTIQQHPDPRGTMVQFTTANPAISQAQIQQQPPQLTKMGLQPGLLGQPIPMIGTHPIITGKPIILTR